MGSDLFLTFDANAENMYEHHHVFPENQFFASKANTHVHMLTLAENKLNISFIFWCSHLN